VAPDTAVTVGGLAEYTLSPAIGAVPVLPELTDRQAAGFPGSFRVAHIGLVHRAAIRPGETLLVLGGSGRTIGALGLGRLVPRYRTNVARGELPVLFLILYGMCLGAGVTGLARAFGIGTHVSFLELTACLALINLAVTASISAVVSIVGSAGAAVGGFLYFLPGSPISGATTAGPLMPAFWHCPDRPVLTSRLAHGLRSAAQRRIASRIHGSDDHDDSGSLDVVAAKAFAAIEASGSPAERCPPARRHRQRR
jgi:hypothetical protein